MLVFLSILACCLSFAAALIQHVHDASFTPDAYLRVSEKNISVGGVYKLTTLINGTADAPPLYLPEGKSVWVRVYNDMDTRNTTMHWHGLSQATYPFSDGTPQASQWPIPPRHYFDYELQLSNISAGTYFYHPHVGFQAASAAGALIIKDRKEPPYKYHAERIILISELYNKSDHYIESGLYNETRFRWSGEPLAYLVNGRGISNFSIEDPSTANLDVIEVEPSKDYRFRFIGGGALTLMALAFENHSNLSIIEADGDYTKPTSVDFIQLGNAQRYSVLFKAKSCAELKALGKTDFYLQIETRERPLSNRNYAILRYKDTCGIKAPKLSTTAYPTTAVLTLPPTDRKFLEYKLKPLEDNNFPQAKEVTRRVIIDMQQVLNNYIVWQDNGISWTEDFENNLPGITRPRVPYLVALYKNQTAHLPDYDAAIKNNGLDPKTGVFPAKIGEVLEIVLQNVGSRSEINTTAGGLDSHPWHLHGKHFFDIGSGPGKWSQEIMEAQLAGSNPVLRDTTMVYRYNTTTQPNAPAGWRAWRIRVESPGVWMVHCHSLQHMVMGMQQVFVFGDAHDILTVPKPEVSGFLEFGGNVYGNGTHYPTVVHFSEMKK